MPHSTALHAAPGRRAGVPAPGPLARYALNHDRLSPLARQAAAAAGLGADVPQPVPSIVVRAVELVYAVDEALRLIDGYEPPTAGVEVVAARAGSGYGATEAPRGMLFHRYELDADGTIRGARIVPPTSQNQAASRTTCAASSQRTASTSTTTSSPPRASRPSATTTPASPARPTSST